MRKWFLIPLIFMIFSCGDQPSQDMIRDDFQRIYPKAEIVLITPVEKSSDTYRANISYRADTSYRIETSGKFLEDVFLYKKINGKWVNTWRRSSGK
ncbi:MAG: hypothetical protein A2W27_12195 [Deltaproteobacteria bacterium RBG_16_44_11]|nr:MAG: hypothetical protein A2W27_12195 [Deltaproteobacteria bacterium RBG_16_44_11]